MCLFFDKIFYYFLPQGRTHAYAKNGSKINSFSSHLPGGNYGQKGRSKSGILVHWRNLASFFWLTSDKFLFTSFKTYIWFDFVELWTYYDRYLVLENVILDCLFDEKEGIYYVLDIMCWSNHPVYDSEVKYENSSWIFLSFIQFR